MATGVQPRNEETQLTLSDIESIKEAMKNKKFRDLFAEYCEEVRNPANQATYQKEMTQLEKERGYDVTFINPKGGYVIKTSVAGDRKAFINICSDENVGKPASSVQELDGKRGMKWQIPYSLIPPREDYDQHREKCVIYDVVFHPDTLRMSEVNKQFRQLVNNTAFEGLQKTYGIHLDINNSRFPKSQYKGMAIPSVIRKEDPEFKPPTEDERTEKNDLDSELLDKLYPQHNYVESNAKCKSTDNLKQKNRTRAGLNEFEHKCKEGYTTPKYLIKQQKNIDLQDYTYNKDSKQYSATPSHLIVEINMPLLSSTMDCILDVNNKHLSLKSEKPAKYKLDINLPYPVNDSCGNAKFDKAKRVLIVTLPVQKMENIITTKLSKVDSGLESEDNSQSDEDKEKENLVVDITSTSEMSFKTEVLQSSQKLDNNDLFFESNLSYILPSYTHNVLDDIVAFTFHVKNTEPDSVKVTKNLNEIYIKFTSIGSGFVPVHYAAIIIFDENVQLENAIGEAWDNNVILQLELVSDMPKKFQIGLRKDDMKFEYFDEPQVTKEIKTDEDNNNHQLEETSVIEVTNYGTETNILVSNINDLDEDNIDMPASVESDMFMMENPLGAKSILRKTMSRSFSESSIGDVASSMDYISSDCIPEGSLKKTVRFNNVIARQFYRHNSSIEGQKKKNQRKKNKKRNQDLRRSESEAEDDVPNNIKSKSSLKSVLKQRRDSGLADTSDAESESNGNKNYSTQYDEMQATSYTSDRNSTSDEDVQKPVLNVIDNPHEKSKPVTWKKDTKTKKSNDNVQHNTNLYDPNKLNKGKYLEVEFKNDLIFDLDM